MQERVALLKSLNSGEKYIARSLTPSTTSISSVSQDRDSFLRASQNSELATKSDIYYAFTTSDPRPPNEIESLFLELQYGTADNYKYVSIYANGSVTDALPSLDSIDPDDQRSQIILSNMMLEASYNTSISTDEIKKGSIVAIQFLDKKNNREPIIVEVPDMKGIATIPGAAAGSKSFNTRSLFISSSPPSLSQTTKDSASKAAIKVGTKIFKGMRGPKGNKACDFLSTWEGYYNGKYKSARTKYADRLYKKPISNAIRNASEKYSLEEDMLRTFAWIESGYDATVRNEETLAGGLLQILPYLTIDGPPNPTKRVRTIYNILFKDVIDPMKNADAVGERLRSVIDKFESESYYIFEIKRLQPWQIYVMHNQGPDGFAVIMTACKLFNDKLEREELVLAAQYLFDRGYGPIVNGGFPYFPKNKETG